MSADTDSEPAAAGSAVSDPPPAPSTAGAVRRLAHKLAAPWQRLSVRITGVVALGALLIMTFGHLLHGRLLDEELRPLLGKQLHDSAIRAAEDIDERLERRARALEAAAAEARARPRAFTPASAQEFLQTQVSLNALFEHLMLIGPDGRVLADRPRVNGLRGTDLSDREYFVQARDSGRIGISEPFMSRVGEHLVVAMAVPLVAPDGSFAGTLVGGHNLMKNGLFGDLRDTRIGAGGYYAAYTLSGLTLLHPDPRRLLQPLPEGQGTPARRALAGLSGWQRGTIDGVDALLAWQRLKQVPWVMLAVQPTAEAFAPLARVDRVLLGSRTAAMVLLTLLVCGVALWALAPLARLRDQIEEIEEGRRTGLIDTAGPHEVAVVANAFNRLKARQQNLADSLARREAFHRTLNDRSPVGVFLFDEKGQLTYCNARFEQMIGDGFDDICGWNWVEYIHEQDRAAARERWLAARWARQGFVQEYRFVQPRGEVVWARVHHEPMGPPTRAPEYLAVALDVTAEHETAERLASERQQGQMILEAISDALIVVSANARVRDMTRAAEKLIGWSREKAHGTPIGRVLRVYDAADAPVDLAEVVGQRSLRTEDWSCETGAGERIAVELVWQCFDDSQTSGGVLSLRDITQRRREAERIAWAAAHDPLTGLKNRRSFEEGMAGAHAQYLRQGLGAAVVMIDLDRFKQVNDRGGHDAGDEMLRRVARVLGEAVRATDMAARLGGDEFALLLPGCSDTRALSIAETVRDAATRLAVTRGGVELGIGASIGITVLAPGDPDWTHAMQRADAACYQAKRAGGNAIRTVLQQVAVKPPVES